jgi:hypothetical protein
MRVPGFTADSSLISHRGHHHAAGSLPRRQAGAVLPQEAHRSPPILIEQQHPDPPQHCSGVVDCVQMVYLGGCPGGSSSALCIGPDCWC